MTRINQTRRYKEIMPVCRPDRTGRTEDKILKFVIVVAIAIHKVFGRGLYEIVRGFVTCDRH